MKKSFGSLMMAAPDAGGRVRLSDQFWREPEATQIDLLAGWIAKLEGLRGVMGAGRGRPLTSRQAAVLALLREGKPNKIIAHELNVSENTVKVHISGIMRRLGVTNRTQAALTAQHRLLPSLGASSSASIKLPERA